MLFVKLTLPASTGLAVAAATLSNVNPPVLVSVPVPVSDPAKSVTAPTVSLKLPMASVPPLIDRAPLPTALVAPRVSVPAERKVVPV